MKFRMLPLGHVVPVRCLVWLVIFAALPLPAADFRITSFGLSNNDVRIDWNAPGGSNYVVQAVTPLRTIGGHFTTFRGLPSFRLAALEVSGLLRPPPYAPPGSLNPISSIVLQPDGKAVVGGSSLLWRLTSSNSLDATFVVPGGINGTVIRLAVHTNATIDVAGSFDQVGGLARRNVARLLQKPLNTQPP